MQELSPATDFESNVAEELRTEKENQSGAQSDNKQKSEDQQPTENGTN